MKHRNQCCIQETFSSMEGNTMGGGGGVFVLLAGFVMGSEKSAGSFLKFIFN